MPLNYLLLHSLVPGGTTAHDPGTGREAVFDKSNNETILVFRLDEPGARSSLGLSGQGQKCCDHLFFYKSQPLTIFLFTELKSRDLGDADQQLLSAIHAVCRDNYVLELKRRGYVRALIVTSLSSPGDNRARAEIQKRMQQNGIEVYFGTSRGRGGSCKVRQFIHELSRGRRQ